jgi:hypothetical protein
MHFLTIRKANVSNNKLKVVSDICITTVKNYYSSEKKVGPLKGPF